MRANVPAIRLSREESRPSAAVLACYGRRALTCHETSRHMSVGLFLHSNDVTHARDVQRAVDGAELDALLNRP